MTRKFRLILYVVLIGFSWLSQLLFPFANMREVIGWTCFVILAAVIVEGINWKKGIK